MIPPVLFRQKLSFVRLIDYLNLVLMYFSRPGSIGEGGVIFLSPVRSIFVEK
jgi:hypothetical protein